MGDDKDEKYLDPGQNPFILQPDPEPESDEDQVESDGLAPFFSSDVPAISGWLEALAQGRNEFEAAGKKITKMADGGFQVAGRNLADLRPDELAALSLLLNNR